MEFEGNKLSGLNRNEESSVVDKETAAQSPESQESSPSGTLKKPRKFKPRKYIAKKLRLRKNEKGSDDQDQTTAGSQSEQESVKSSVSSKLSEKLSSPKLQRFKFMKRFSSGRKISPLSDDAGEDSRSSVRSLSISDVSVHEEKEEYEVQQNFISQVDIPLIPSQNEAVTLESKKVELKITMAKFEKRSTSPLERESVGMASSSSSDIELPSKTRTSREQFFAKPSYVEQQVKPINDETFAAVVREGFSVKSPPAQNLSVEKYLELTTSIQTILSTAKDLEEFGARGDVDKLTFPQLPELKILEEKDKLESVKTSSEKINKNSLDVPETRSLRLKDQSETSDKVNELEKREIKRTSGVFNTSTPIRPEAEQETVELEESNIEESDKMRKQRKSKIPVDEKRLSASFDAATSLTTVHTQEAKSPYHVNLSSSSSEESSVKISELTPNEILFQLGTPVKNFPSGSSNSINNIAAPIAIPENDNHESFDESFHSPSEKSLQPESITRRKIAYVPQSTIYTPEEIEILKSSFEANADSLDLNSTQADSSVFPVFDDSVVRNFKVLFRLKESCREGNFVVRRGIERLLKP